MIFSKENCEIYEKTKTGTRIITHCVPISVSIDIYIGFSYIGNHKKISYGKVV